MKIGADPELFLKDKHGLFISSINLIGGSKSKPRPIREDGCAVQEDNVAVEFNIPPAESITAFINSINFSLNFLTDEVKKKGLSLAIVPSAEFSKDQLEHPHAKEFGCDPDYNAWTQQVNPKPFSKNKQLRSAGGHIHVGFDGEKLNPFDVVKAMDVFLALPSLELDDDMRRRELYGKAGACRLKEYGVEYRTLSNFWLKTDELKKWVYNQTLTSVNFIREGGHFSNAQGKIIQHCINTSDKLLAKHLLAEYGM